MVDHRSVKYSVYITLMAPRGWISCSRVEQVTSRCGTTMAIFFVAAALVAAVFATTFYWKTTSAMCKSKRRLNGKTALVTGGTDGMGLQIAIEFAKRGARVIIACPFPEEGADALKTIIEESGNENVEFKLLNLASFASVRQFTSDILKNESRLDILLNNAGTAARGLCTTKDGMNFIMQVNYLGQFLQTILLLPLLMKTGTLALPSRIVNTGSILHHIGCIDIPNLNQPSNKWMAVQKYGSSKLALLSFTFELANRLRGSGVVVNAVDPGAVGTNIFYGLNSLVGVVVKFFLRNICKTPWMGAQTALHVALDEELNNVNGCYFANCQPIKANRTASEEETARLLWRETAKLVGLSEEEVNRCLKGIL